MRSILINLKAFLMVQALSLSHQWRRVVWDVLGCCISSWLCKWLYIKKNNNNFLSMLPIMREEGATDCVSIFNLKPNVLTNYTVPYVNQYTDTQLSIRPSILTFIVETIDAIDWGAFMVTPEQEEVLWVFDFVGQQKTDSLEWLFAPINIISKEQVVTFRRIATIFKEPEKIIVLSMDVTYKEKSRPTWRNVKQDQNFWL